jgi:hypothetical protein
MRDAAAGRKGPAAAWDLRAQRPVVTSIVLPSSRVT